MGNAGSDGGRAASLDSPMIFVEAVLALGGSSGRDCIIDHREQAEARAPAVYADGRLPLLTLLIPTNTCHAARIVSASARVLHVVAVRAVLEIAPAVVAALTIFVVDLVGFLTSHHFPDDTVCEILFPENRSAPMTAVGGGGHRLFARKARVPSVPCPGSWKHFARALAPIQFPGIGLVAEEFAQDGLGGEVVRHYHQPAMRRRSVPTAKATAYIPATTIRVSMYQGMPVILPPRSLLSAVH